MTPVTFYDLNRSSGIELDLLATSRDNIQDGGEYLHDLLSFKFFYICAKNQKINELRLNLYKT